MLFLIASYFPMILWKRFAFFPSTPQVLRDWDNIIGDRVEEAIMSFTPTPAYTLHALPTYAVIHCRN